MYDDGFVLERLVDSAAKRAVGDAPTATELTVFPLPLMREVPVDRLSKKNPALSRCCDMSRAMGRVVELAAEVEVAKFRPTVHEAGWDSVRKHRRQIESIAALLGARVCGKRIIIARRRRRRCRHAANALLPPIRVRNMVRVGKTTIPTTRYANRFWRVL